jgi:hypothetical protein
LAGKDTAGIPDSLIARAGMSDAILVSPADRVSLVDNPARGNEIEAGDIDLMNCGLCGNRKQHNRHRNNDKSGQHDASYNALLGGLFYYIEFEFVTAWDWAKIKTPHLKLWN